MDLSNSRRHGNNEIRSGGYIFYWSGRYDGARLKGVSKAISRWLQSFFPAINQVDKLMMMVKLKNTLCFTFLYCIFSKWNV